MNARHKESQTIIHPIVPIVLSILVAEEKKRMLESEMARKAETYIFDFLAEREQSEVKVSKPRI